MNKVITALIVVTLLAGGYWVYTQSKTKSDISEVTNNQNSEAQDSDIQYYEDGTQITYCDVDGNRYNTIGEAEAAGLTPAEFGATYCPEYLQELPPLQANGWYWKETQYNSGDVVNAKEPAKFLTTFMSDGEFSATTDCNNGGGSYKTDGGQLTFGPIAATKKACMEENQEADFFNMLGEVQSYFITEDGNLVLQLKFDSGVMLFTPAR